jgi:hypothetical protein
VGGLVQNIKQLFESVLENFFNKKQIKEFSRINLSISKLLQKKELQAISKSNKSIWKLMII